MTITPKGHYCDVATREELPILEMSPEEVLERSELNIKNTTESRRKAVLAELSKTNGKGNGRNGEVSSM